LRTGLTRPQYRTSLNGGAAAVYELPASESGTRTVMVRTDVALRIGRSVEKLFAEGVRVVRVLGQSADARLVIQHRLARKVDLAIRTAAAWEASSDTSVRVTRGIQCRGDTHQLIGRRLNVAADLNQTVYRVLVDETHVIAT
jgi:hypothetical protein